MKFIYLYCILIIITSVTCRYGHYKSHYAELKKLEKEGKYEFVYPAIERHVGNFVSSISNAFNFVKNKVHNFVSNFSVDKYNEVIRIAFVKVHDTMRKISFRCFDNGETEVLKRCVIVRYE